MLFYYCAISSRKIETRIYGVADKIVQDLKNMKKSLRSPYICRDFSLNMLAPLPCRLETSHFVSFLQTLVQRLILEDLFLL